MDWRAVSYGLIGFGVLAIIMTGGKEAAQKLESDSRERAAYTDGLSRLRAKTQDLTIEGSDAFRLVTKSRPCRPVRAMSLSKQIGGKKGWNSVALAVGQIATIDGKREEPFPAGELICTEDGQIAMVGADGKVLNPLGNASADPSQIPRVPPKDMDEFRQFFAYVSSLPGPVAVASSIEELQFLRNEEQSAGINIDSMSSAAQAATTPVQPPPIYPGVQTPDPAPVVPRPEPSPSIPPATKLPVLGDQTLGNLPKVRVE